MANLDHLALLKSGAVRWIEWRRKNPDIEPDLSVANLRGINLRGGSLSKANFRGADLCNTLLIRANLNKANFSMANLSGAMLIEASLSDGKSLNIW